MYVCELCHIRTYFGVGMQSLTAELVQLLCNCMHSQISVWQLTVPKLVYNFLCM